MEKNMIHAAFDKLEVTEAQKERMLKNILSAKKPSPVLVWTKRLSVPVAAALALVLFIPMYQNQFNPPDDATTQLQASTDPAVDSEQYKHSGEVKIDGIGQPESHLKGGPASANSGSSFSPDPLEQDTLTTVMSTESTEIQNNAVFIWNGRNYIDTHTAVFNPSTIGEQLGVVLEGSEYLLGAEVYTYTLSKDHLVVKTDGAYYLFCDSSNLPVDAPGGAPIQE